MGFLAATLAYKLVEKARWKKSIMFGVIVGVLSFVLNNIFANMVNNYALGSLVVGVVAYLVATYLNGYKTRKALKVAVYTVVGNFAITVFIITILFTLLGGTMFLGLLAGGLF